MQFVGVQTEIYMPFLLITRIDFTFISKTVVTISPSADVCPPHRLHFSFLGCGPLPTPCPSDLLPARELL